MIFRTGRFGVLSRSHFAYKNKDYYLSLEGYEESYQHEFFKDAIYRLDTLNLIINNKKITIWVDSMELEEHILVNGKEYIVDIMAYFKKSYPEEYCLKWQGKLAIEVWQTHKVDDVKVFNFKKAQVAMVEFKANTLENINDIFYSREDEERQFERVLKKLKEKIYVRVISDLETKEYLEMQELENYKERIILLKNMVEEFKNNEKLLIEQIAKLKEDNKFLSFKNENIEKENNKIKSWWLYRVFYKK